MLHQISQAQVDQMRSAHELVAGQVQNISPYHNPAHVLAPPRQWLEALLRGEYSWHFFRLRYKNLLRRRFQEESIRFFSLLEASEQDRSMYLTCHCLAGNCHREIAVEFLENLRQQGPYQRYRSALVARRLPTILPGEPLPLASNG